MRKAKNPAPKIMPTSIRFPEDLLTFLRNKAQERGWTLTMVVLEMVRQFKAFEEKVPKKK